MARRARCQRVHSGLTQKVRDIEAVKFSVEAAFLKAASDQLPNLGSMDGEMDISEVARRAGVAASTLRFYEKKGLISATRSAGGRRHFAPGVLDQLAMIAMGQAAGLSLDEIRAMQSPCGAPRLDRALLLARADEIDAAARRMQAMSHSLRRAAACTARSHTECQTFQRLLKVAAAGRLKPKPAREPHGLHP